MALPFPVAIHLGVHKTATSYIQRVLAANAAVLAARGIAYLPLETMRPTVTRASVTGVAAHFAPARRTVAEAVQRAAPVRRLVLSDENLLGSPEGLVDGRGFYRAAADHAAFLIHAVLEAEQPLLFLCVRSYEEFVASAYAELLWHRPFRTFDEYLERFSLDALSWRDLVRRLCRVAGPERLVLWDFRLFQRCPEAVFAALLGGSELPALPRDRTRPSLSGKAIEALGALRPQASDEAIQGEVGRMHRRFPRRAHPAFQPFHPAMRDRLQRRFARDLAAIRAEFPAVRILDDEARPQPFEPPDVTLGCS